VFTASRCPYPPHLWPNPTSTEPWEVEQGKPVSKITARGKKPVFNVNEIFPN